MRREADPRRSAAWGRGRIAEALAAGLLLAKGYRILARRWASGAGEVDIVARRAGVLVFVEVKARREPDYAENTVAPRQRRRIRMAAEPWLAAHPRDQDHDVRFDVIVVARGHWPRHIVAAFDGEE